MDPSYRYKRLNLGTDAIRLIRILKGDTGPIECEMLETYLNKVEEHPYEALSYVWGNSGPKYKIWVDGCQFTVAENLFEALSNLRQPGEDRLFWIDAICINQHHHAERGHQVGQMRRIYENARIVVIWLGPSTREIDRLFFWMRRLDNHMLTPEHRLFIDHMDMWKNGWKSLGPQYGEFQHDIISRGLKDLLEREWFCRIWVIQEVALADTAFITCGRSSVSSRAFIVMPELLWVSCNENVQSRLEIMPGLLRERSWWWSGPEYQDLGLLLQKFGKSEASDPRDIIYALLGLSEAAFTSRFLRPDYELTLQEAIQRTVAYLLTRSRVVHANSSFHYNMPTWSMDQFLHALEDLPVEVYEWTRSHRKACVPEIYSDLKEVIERAYLND